MLTVAALEQSATPKEIRAAFEAVSEGQATQPCDILSEDYPTSFIAHMRCSGDTELPLILYYKHWLTKSKVWKAFFQDLAEDPASIRLFRIKGCRAPWVMTMMRPTGSAVGHPRIEIPPRDAMSDSVWLLPFAVWLKEFVDSEYPLDKVDKETEEEENDSND